MHCTFGAEEVGLKVSIDYVPNAATANKDIRMMVNTDMTDSEPSSNNWLRISKIIKVANTLIRLDISLHKVIVILHQ